MLDILIPSSRTIRLVSELLKSQGYSCGFWFCGVGRGKVIAESKVMSYSLRVRVEGKLLLFVMMIGLSTTPPENVIVKMSPVFPQFWMSCANVKVDDWRKVLFSSGSLMYGLLLLLEMSLLFWYLKTNSISYK